MDIIHSDDVNKSINFVWGNIGRGLQKKDKKRMIAIAQLNHEHHLSVLANIDIEKIIDEIFDKDFVELTEKHIKMIIELNETDNTFREIARFLKKSQDMLSVGSTITGQIDKKTIPLKVSYGDNEND